MSNFQKKSILECWYNPTFLNIYTFIHFSILLDYGNVWTIYNTLHTHAQNVPLVFLVFHILTSTARRNRNQIRNPSFDVSVCTEQCLMRKFNKLLSYRVRIILTLIVQCWSWTEAGAHAFIGNRNLLQTLKAPNFLLLAETKVPSINRLCISLLLQIPVGSWSNTKADSCSTGLLPRSIFRLILTFKDFEF